MRVLGSWIQPGPRQSGPQLKTTLCAPETDLKIPNASKAHISATKLRGYLLSTDHPVGRFKARYFAALGFTIDNWEDLRRLLQELALGDAELESASEYGKKYRVSGQLTGPKGSSEVVAVWIISAGKDVPRLVTVYPK